MANLSRTPSQFFINLLFIFTLTMTMYSFFRALGSLCASLDIGEATTCFKKLPDFNLLTIIKLLDLRVSPFRHWLYTRVNILPTNIPLYSYHTGTNKSRLLDSTLENASMA